MLLVVAVVARMKAVEVGEHSEGFGNTAVVEDAHPHRAPVFPRRRDRARPSTSSAKIQATSLVVTLLRPIYTSWLFRICLPVYSGCPHSIPPP